MPKLSDDQRETAIADLRQWEWDGSREGIFRSFKFRNFSEAFAFMTRIALLAEKADHHPEWTNVWDRVDIFLTTHSAGGLTAKDVDLAKSINALAAQLALAGGGQ